MEKIYVKIIETDCHKEIKKLFLFLFARKRGGENRSKIVSLLRIRPYNANQLSMKLGLDYKLIQHALKIFENNNVIIKTDNTYGATYFLTPLLESNMTLFDEIVSKREESLE